MKRQVVDLIGNTPLIKLEKASEETGCNIFGKAEFLNPGQSVKDRAALEIIKQAIASKDIGPGGSIVEGTAGNTGIGLSLVASFYGFKSVIVIPETQSEEKKEALKMLGAKLVQVPAKPYSDPNNYIKYSERLASELNNVSKTGAFWANQFDNLNNRKAHIKNTSQEIFEQTNGKIDGFICSVGTGGTLAGVSIGLKQRNSNIKIGLADPDGSALFKHYTDGILKSEGSSITEGIGQGRITKNLEGLKPDFSYNIKDDEALKVIYSLIIEEGLSLGTSSGINICGAIKMGKELGPGHTIVTILCDHSQRYKSKLFNIEFLKERNLPIPVWFKNESQDLPNVLI
ncbi:cysteine synthase A [Paracoccaceae bacterium]|nr:cysteine synthase A [Paracoccaceae bacterium]